MNGQTRSPAGSPRVRRARAEDAATIAGFNREMARETEGRNLAADTLHEGVTTVLRDPHHGFYLMAEIEGQRVGALLVTFEWSDWRNAPFWWIQSVYVIPAARGRGVYRALHAEVCHAAEAQGACGIRLYVEKDNRAAQNAYASLGMRESAYRIYEQEFHSR